MKPLKRPDPRAYLVQMIPENAKIKNLLGQVLLWRYKDTEGNLEGPCWAFCFSAALSHAALLSRSSQDAPHQTQACTSLPVSLGICSQINSRAFLS